MVKGGAAVLLVRWNAAGTDVRFELPAGGGTVGYVGDVPARTPGRPSEGEIMAHALRLVREGAGR